MVRNTQDFYFCKRQSYIRFAKGLQETNRFGTFSLLYDLYCSISMKDTIKKTALNLGFDLVGITSADPIEPADQQAIKNWLDKGLAGNMQYMQKNLDKRLNPALLLENTKSIICVALNYRSDQTQSNASLKVANYAQYEDYHSFIKQRLFQLAKEIDSILPKRTTWKFKACVDTAPAAERTLAQRAGLGFIGRNHLLIHPQLGAQLLLGELITTLNLEPDTPMENTFCSGCDRCIRACPTGALCSNGIFNTLDCISYITQYGPCPDHCKKFITNHLFGCDECILACPLEQKATSRKNLDFKRLSFLENVSAHQITQMNESDFKKQYADSCIQFIGYQKFRENAEQCRLIGENQGTRKMSS